MSLLYISPLITWLLIEEINNFTKYTKKYLVDLIVFFIRPGVVILLQIVWGKDTIPHGSQTLDGGSLTFIHELCGPEAV